MMVGASLLVGSTALPLVGSGAQLASTTTSDDSGSVCTAPSVLVLSAMPLELDPLLAHAHVDLNDPVMINSRPFVTGTLDGNQVIMGLTGIGPQNALATTTGAFERFRCGDTSSIADVVFSGTSGGASIGDVFVPQNWSYDGQTPVDTNATLLQIAEDAPLPQLESSTPPGDPACACEATDQTATPITVTQRPTVSFVGTGLTTDPFGGRTLPCVPTGNDIFGCTPCRELDSGTLGQVNNLAQNGPSFVDPNFFLGYLNSTTPSGSWVSEDEETAIVAQVATANSTPFIGFRAASDGGGDPLNLPGFPFQFFVYRQLAANNAAAMALSFLQQLAAQP